MNRWEKTKIGRTVERGTRAMEDQTVPIDYRSRDEPGADPIWEYVTIDGQKYARKKSA
jgi:hypothetical protein